MKTDRKKILYVITKSNWGGAQRYVFDLALKSKDAGMDVCVACGGNGLLADRLKNENIKVVRMISSRRDINLLKDIRLFFEIYKIIRGNKPDIVHVNSSKVGGIGAAAVRLRFKACILFTVHGLPQYEDRAFATRMLIGLLTWITCLLSHKVIVLTKHDMKALLKQPFLKKKLALISHGIHETFLSQEESRKIIVESAHETITDSDRVKMMSLTWVGTIGELHKNKGHAYALRAFADLAKTNRNVMYIVVGSGEERKHLESTAQQLGIQDRVLFVGFIADAGRLYKAFDIALLTSIKEGLPYTLIEAALAGIPIIATNVGGVPDIISNEKTGLVVAPQDSSAVYDSLTRLITDGSLRKNLGKNAEHFSKEHFTLSKMTMRTHALYKDCLSQRR